MTPYQIRDSRRPWIKQEERAFTRLLREFKVDLDRKVYFEEEEASIENHFRVLETLETDPLCLWLRIKSKETFETLAEMSEDESQEPSAELSDEECPDQVDEMSTEENLVLRADVSDEESQRNITAMSNDSDDAGENRCESGERENTDLICIEYPGQVDHPDRAIKTLGGLQNIGMVLSEPNRQGLK